MPQNRQKLVFGDGVDASMDGGGRRRPTEDKDVEGVFCLFQRVAIFIVTFGRVTKIW